MDKIKEIKVMNVKTGFMTAVKDWSLNKKIIKFWKKIIMKTWKSNKGRKGFA